MKLRSTLIALACALSLAAGAAHASVVTSSNVPVRICDLCIATSTLNVNSHFTLADLNMRLTVLHTFDSDLLIQLISPTGTTVTLSNNRGGGGDNFTNTLFDDEALAAIAAGNAPFNGSYRPDSLLSAFDGQDAYGTWTLRITDEAERDSGWITAWSLNMTAAASNVPEPASLALSVAALAGLAATRRRRQA